MPESDSRDIVASSNRASSSESCYPALKFRLLTLLIVMTILAIPLAIVGALLIRGPVVEESAIEQVHEGMAKREVRRILGSPHIRGDDDICWYYYYREDQAVAGEPATIQFDGHNRVHAIYR